MQLIHPRDVWNHIRLPEVPTGAINDARLNAEQNELLHNALNILRMLRKPDGQRRSIYGLNRVAQRTYPDFKWAIQDTEIVADVWKIAGIDALVDSILEWTPERAFRSRFTFGRIALVEFGSIESLCDRPSEVFISADYVVARERYPDLHWKLYRVAAKTKYGRYLFYLGSHAPPTDWTIESFCIEHNRVSK
jgi:hypothetical protein